MNVSILGFLLRYHLLYGMVPSAIRGRRKYHVPPCHLAQYHLRQSCLQRQLHIRNRLYRSVIDLPLASVTIWANVPYSIQHTIQHIS
jgi:hypothetical protein